MRSDIIQRQEKLYYLRIMKMKMDMEISERAVEVLFSRLRWRTHETFKTPRMLLTTNPTINWVRSRFVQDENGDKVICREGEAYIPFSVFDNPNIAFRQVYEAALNKIRDQATKERLLYGLSLIHIYLRPFSI